MKNLFTENNPFLSALSSLGDLIILNALFLVFSLPVFTIGASFTSAFYVAHSLSIHSCSGVIKEYLFAFKSNFKQSSLIWCFSLPLFLLLGLYYLLAISNSYSSMHHWLLLLLVICILLLAILCYVFPLIGRYRNTLKDHLKNAIILAISNFPRTILLMLICLIPVMLLLVSPGLFFYALPFWVLVGFAVLIKLSVVVIKPVLNQLDQLSAN